MKKKDRLLTEEYFLAVIMIVMLLLCFINVILRYVFKSSLMFTDTLLGLLFPWVTFLGVPAACRRRKNTSFTLLMDAVPSKYQKYVELACNLICCALFGLLLYYGVLKTWGYYSYHTVIGTLNDAPRWPFSICIPLGSILYIYRSVQVIVEEFHSHSGKLEPNEEVQI